jgi:phosphohistidine phosphatase SixA
MYLLVVRHIHPIKREDWNNLGKPDSLRPISIKNDPQWNKAITGLKTLVPSIDKIYTSECTRAIQTAEILQKHYKECELNKSSKLNPNNSFKGLNKLLKLQRAKSTIALVGHGSDLSLLTSYLIGSDIDLKICHKKGAAALFKLKKGSVQLCWLLTQKQLSCISKV